jgi:hyperosmotically inducible periplasmic protein
MIKRGLKIFLPISLVVLLPVFGLKVFASVPKQAASSLTDELRHELLMLPYYNVFDEISFRIEGANTVVLSGEVTRPLLKSDAEATVHNIPEVGQVVNNIKVLPLSPSDNRIRLNMLWAIYSRPGLEKYAIPADPPIRIIVDNGQVTLDGVVATQMDKQMTEMAAKSVSGVFSVTDNLKVS